MTRYTTIYRQPPGRKVDGLATEPLSRGCEGGGGGWGGGVTSYIWHSTVVHAEWPPFSALPGI